MMLQRTVAELAALAGGRVEGEGQRSVERLASPEGAGPDDLAAVFRGAVPARCRAGALLLGEDTDPGPCAGAALIRAADPEEALDLLLAALAPDEGAPPAGRHPTAVVEDGALVDGTAALGAHVYVGAGARIGARAVLWPGVVVGAHAEVGADTVLRARAVLEPRCVLGERVLVHPGAVLGADGFGFRERDGRLLKSPQVGTVVVGDDVEIGANTTIDRGRFEATVIGDRTKIDDGVHIAHNCRVGRDCGLAGQVALAGGAELGDGVRMGGRSGTGDHVKVAAGTVVGALAVVMRDVQEPDLLLGQPARPAKRWQELQGALGLLARKELKRQGRTGADRGA